MWALIGFQRPTGVRAPQKWSTEKCPDKWVFSELKRKSQQPASYYSKITELLFFPLLMRAKRRKAKSPWMQCGLAGYVWGPSCRGMLHDAYMLSRVPGLVPPKGRTFTKVLTPSLTIKWNPQEMLLSSPPLPQPSLSLASTCYGPSLK